jgi:hypothetical protein
MPHEYGALIAELRDTLTRQRYNRVVIHNYCHNADCFLSYLAGREVDLEAVTPTEVADYLRLAVRMFRERHGRVPARYWVNIPRAGIHGLLNLALKRWPPEPAAADAGELLCREVCDQYQTWLREQRGLATASIDALMWEARYFCAWYIKRSGTDSFADLSVRDSHGDPKLARPRQPRHHKPLRPGKSSNETPGAGTPRKSITTSKATIVEARPKCSCLARHPIAAQIMWRRSPNIPE